MSGRKEKQGWMPGKDSFSKVRVYFADGSKGTFFSLDWVHRFSKSRDPDLGLKRLRKLISLWGAKAKVAIVYDLITDTEIERYKEGNKLNT